MCKPGRCLLHDLKNAGEREKLYFHGNIIDTLSFCVEEEFTPGVEMGVSGERLRLESENEPFFATFFEWIILSLKAG